MAYLRQKRSSGTLGCFFWYLFLQKQEKYIPAAVGGKNRAAEKKIGSFEPIFQRIMQSSPLEPSLMTRLSVSHSFSRDSSGTCESLFLMLSFMRS